MLGAHVGPEGCVLGGNAAEPEIGCADLLPGLLVLADLLDQLVFRFQVVEELTRLLLVGLRRRWATCV